MSVKNLHSLLNRPWYIDLAYAQSQLPLLLNMIEGKSQGLIDAKPELPIAALINTAGIQLDQKIPSEEKAVAVIDFKSPIYKYDQSCGPEGTQSKKAILERLKNEDRIAAVVLDFDSGGGQAYGTPELYDYLVSYPKPVVSYTGGIMCSAAYYLGSAASHIVANKRAEAIGSIGAYTQLLDMSGALEKQGVKVHTIYAEKSTEKNKAYNDALQGNYDTYIKQELNPLVDDFIADIKAVRPGVKEVVFKGATYKAPKALSMGLVDSLGTLEDAVNIAFQLSNSKQKSTPNNETMKKPNSFPNLEAALGLNAPLAINDDGSYLNEDQKATIERTFSANATALKNAQDEAAQAKTDLTSELSEAATALSTEKDNTAAAIAGLRAAATLAGVEALAEDATAEVIQTALTAKIEELNKLPGATHTTGAAQDKSKKEFAYIDTNNSIYSQFQ